MNLDPKDHATRVQAPRLSGLLELWDAVELGELQLAKKNWSRWKYQVSHPGYWNMTPMHYAAFIGNVEFLDFLLSNGGVVITSFHIHINHFQLRHWLKLLFLFLTKRQCLSVYTFILSYSIDQVDLPDIDGWLPLHYASQCGHALAVIKLLQHGARDRKNYQKQFAKDLAKSVDVMLAFQANSKELTWLEHSLGTTYLQAQREQAKGAMNWFINVQSVEFDEQ